MLQALRTFGRILARHWPALVAWYLGGEAVHQLLVQLAGFVGGLTTLGGLLLLPLAVAARLISYVAMYLAVQPSLPHAAPEGESGPRRFAQAILTAILPFFAFSAAWGLLDADLIEFFRIASSIALRDAGYDLDQLGDRGGLVAIGVLPVAVLVIALVVRVVLARFGARLPSWTLVVAAYAEVLWTFMLFTLVGQWWANTKEWLAERAAAVWLDGVGDWFAANLVPVAALWEGAVWLVGFLVAAVFVPAAWLTIAGVTYGTAFDETPPVLRRFAGASNGTVSRLVTIVTRRFEELWAAVALIWRGGPVVFGCLAVAYAVWAWATQVGSRAVLGIFGGQETSFWAAFLPLLLVAVGVIAEPLRVAIVATAFDAVIGRPEAEMGTRDSELDGEPGDLAVAGDLEHERAVGVVGKQEDGEQGVGP
ncbi:hypothetical protein [Microbacterium sp. TPD7012]|uniref:hypothetical protein n=1 Tax=Microbacterium sp. TPD7012 TaxID=2171975 RepID=UPI000D51BAAE|nr:hypothetical protein [Microbacterium sp. TPD7012]PVE94673.1 hypothetical protein DC434_11980 [Microbacterium sp. TPD7012]